MERKLAYKELEGRSKDLERESSVQHLMESDPERELKKFRVLYD